MLRLGSGGKRANDLFESLKMKIIEGKETEYQKYVTLNSSDLYSRGVVDYAEAWADLMEAEMAAGKQLVEIAHEASDRADTDGITGFMYGCAVSALAKFWFHGEELRRWHNLKTQINHEGEKANEEGSTLNPALLVIGNK